MKWLKSKSLFSRSLFPRLAGGFARIFATTTLCWGIALQAAEPASQPARPAPAPEKQAPAAAPRPAASPAPEAGASAEVFAPLVAAVLRMSAAGVSTSVMKTFIECSPSPEPLTEADVIALKQRNVADEVVSLLLQQSSKAREIEAQRRNEVIAQVLAARNARSGGMDPESYDYFRHHYLQPRATAAAYERLYPYMGPYAGPWGPVPYGFSSGWEGRRNGYGRRFRSVR